MKTIAPVTLSLCLAIALHAQEAAPALPTVPSTDPAHANATAQRTPETLDTLLGPIALYPDALVALILPAATSPSDVVLASRYLQAGGDLAATDSQTWSESVKALVHYPDVLKWMDQNLAWTQALGEAFLDQPTDVMNAVQRLRARARASGALVDTPQQHVLDPAGQIVIVPAQPDVVYVPVYDPSVVYVQRTVVVNRPFLTFGFGYPIDGWFIYNCDWDRRTVWVVSRPPDWRSRPQYWHHTSAYPQKLPGQPWHPPVNNRPQNNTQFYTRPPTPRPIRIESLHPSQTISPHMPRPTHPEAGSPGMMPSTPNRPQTHIPRASIITPGATAPRPLAPVTTQPARPSHPVSDNHSYQPALIQPPTRSTPTVSVTHPASTESTQTDSPKWKRLP